MSRPFKTSGLKRTNAGAKPSIYNVSMTTASTEYSKILPHNCKAFSIKLRNPGFDLKVNVGETASLSGTTYLTVPSGSSFGQEGLNTNNVTYLYFQTTTNSQVAEIITWE